MNFYSLAIGLTYGILCLSNTIVICQICKNCKNLCNALTRSSCTIVKDVMFYSLRNTFIFAKCICQMADHFNVIRLILCPLNYTGRQWKVVVLGQRRVYLYHHVLDCGFFSSSLIDWILFYAVSAIFQPYNGGS